MTTTRITQNMMAGRSLSTLQGTLARLASSQEKVSTGRVVNRVSDDPNAASAAMRFQSAMNEQASYSRNADDAVAWLGTIDNTLSSMSTSLRRAKELALSGANTATSTQSSRAALVAEISQIRASLVADANTNYLGRPVFGGLTAGSAAYADDGTYIGVPGQVMRTVGQDVQLRVDVTGTDVLGANGASVFDDLDALTAGIAAGDETAIRTALSQLDGRLTTVTTTQSQIGATYNRAEAAASAAQSRSDDLRQQLSDVRDADMPKAFMDLQMQEVAYQAALAATARVMQPSLVSFLQ